MSNLAAHWSETAPVADTYERIIVGALCRRADDDGTGAWPAVKTMARMALCDERTVQRRLHSMLKRKLIARGDQRLVKHLPKGQRPTVYDVLIPRSWYSDAQWDEAMAARARSGRSPIDPASRPDIAPPASTGRAKRADTGKPNPKRSRNKQVIGDDLNGQVSGDDQGNVDNSPRESGQSTPAPDAPPGKSSISADQPTDSTQRDVSQSPLGRGDSQTGEGCLTDTGGVSFSHPNPSLNPSLNPSSSFGSSIAADDAAGAVEEEEVIENEEQGNDAAELLNEYARFRPGRWLSADARVKCEQLVNERLAAGWDRATLAGYVREWSAQAHNPTTFLPQVIGELDVQPPAARRSAPKQRVAAAEATPAASDDHKAAMRGQIDVILNKPKRRSAATTP